MDIARARGDALTVAVLEQVAPDDAQLHRMRRERKELAHGPRCARRRSCSGGRSRRARAARVRDRARPPARPRGRGRRRVGLRAAANVPRVTGVAVERVVLGLHTQEAARAAARPRPRAASRPPTKPALPRARQRRATT